MDQIRKNEIIAVGLFAISLFLLLSLSTFSSQDLSFYTSSPNAAARNVTGILGSYIGAILLFFMGKAAFVIPLLIMVWGILRLSQTEARNVFFKLFGAAVLVTAVSASLSMMGVSGRTAAFRFGGVIGMLVSDFLLEYTGRMGASVFIFAMIILSVLVATEFLILPVLISCYRSLSKMLGGTVSSFIKNWKERASLENSQKREKVRKTIAAKIGSMKERVLKPRVAESQQNVPKTSFNEPNIVSRNAPLKKAPQAPVRVTPVADGSTGKKVKYKLPGFDLLNSPQKGNFKQRDEDLKAKAAILERTLHEFGVEAKVVKVNKGPVITMYELEPTVGTKVNRITSLGDNISLAMRSANIRIVAPLPGKGTIGIEVPNKKSELVLFREILETEEYADSNSVLKLAIGKDISGNPIIIDLAAMPHLLIAGATGSGKTVCINCIISSLLFGASPDELKFVMVDPKRVELMMFEGIPHLLTPIVTNPKKTVVALNWIVGEMERRYEVFASKGVRNIGTYRERMAAGDESMPYIVVVVDELADLMMVAQQDIEALIMRIAQLSRAAGIHLILATQRPSVNVITGVIKANFPARISFKVASKVDSRTILDANGAEKLLGRGDMLIMEPGAPNILRGQCSLVEDNEIRSLVKHIKSQAGTQYVEEVTAKKDTGPGGAAHEKDDLYKDAIEVVLTTKQASVSMIQRRLRIGYTRAARMIDVMEAEGIVGPYNGSKAREILIDNMETVEDR